MSGFYSRVEIFRALPGAKQRNNNTTMNDTERNVHNAMTALQGEQPSRVGKQNMRRVNLESISVLQMVGSPFAPVFNAALNGERIEAPATTAVDIAVFAWAHSAPEDEVLQTALQCAPDFAVPATRAAMQWVRSWSMAEVAEVIEYAMRDAKAVAAANFDMAAPDYGTPGGKKK